MLATVLFCLRVPNDSIGMAAGTPWYTHFTYSFFHVGVLHLIVNCWALLCVVFTYDINVRMLLTAFLVAASFPASLFPSAVVTIGASGFIYALFGRISLSVIRKWYFQGWTAFFIGIGFLFPGTNAWLHLWCYLLGLALAFLNKPLSR